MSQTSPLCVISGAGPGNGLSLARRFLDQEYCVALLARSAEHLEALTDGLPRARAYPADVGDADAVHEAFQRIRRELGSPQVFVHNAGSAAFGSFEQITPEAFEGAWRTNALGLLLCAQQVAPDMLEAGRGHIIVIGATAARRGAAGFAAFAPAKAAQRSLAESMARSLGPRGIHVAYVLIDGVVDMPRTRAFFPEKPEDFFLRPERIAESVWHLVQQDRSAWSFELDLRPFAESW